MLLLRVPHGYSMGWMVNTTPLTTNTIPCRYGYKPHLYRCSYYTRLWVVTNHGDSFPRSNPWEHGTPLEGVLHSYGFVTWEGLYPLNTYRLLQNILTHIQFLCWLCLVTSSHTAWLYGWPSVPSCAGAPMDGQPIMPCCMTAGDQAWSMETMHAYVPCGGLPDGHAVWLPVTMHNQCEN